jgi:excisionase family DNA binding protein
MMTDQSEWVSLGEAARLLGVHPTTVRNWADQGDLPFRRTPGRHRRFQRAALEEWAARNKITEKPHGSARNAQVVVEFALGHTRFSVGEGDMRTQGWYEKLSEEAVDSLRHIGRKTLELLLHHLEDAEPEDKEFEGAHELGEEYAELLKGEGLTLPQTVRGFVYFDDFLIESVIQMMAPNMSSSPSEWSDLLRQINAWTNEVLIAMTTYYQAL